MKGVITLTVEVDYTEMLKDENIAVLEGFTGLKTEEALRNHHLSSLSHSIMKSVEGVPFTIYNLEGVFTPLEEKTSIIDGWLNAVEQEESIGKTKVVEPVITQNELIDLGFEFEEPLTAPALPMHAKKKKVAPSTPSVDICILLEEAIERVAMEFGIPTLIRVNEEMQEALSHDMKIGDLKTTMYQGFPVEQEGMAELFIIDYKAYRNNEKKSYTPME